MIDIQSKQYTLIGTIDTITYTLKNSLNSSFNGSILQRLECPIAMNKERQNGSLSQHAYEELKAKILSNDIRSGRFYLERELAELLGISRTPLKEALVRLENEGLIIIQPRHGIQVQPLSADDMEEIYQVITCLECEAVLKLTELGVSDATIKAMENAGQRMVAALDVGDLEAWARADEDFHYNLLEFCGNNRLKQTALNFWDQAHRARYLTLHLRETPVNSTKDHRDVIEAIKEGHAEKAAYIHRQHRIKGGKALVDIIRRFRLDTI